MRPSAPREVDLTTLFYRKQLQHPQPRQGEDEGVLRAGVREYDYCGVSGNMKGGSALAFGGFWGGGDVGRSVRGHGNPIARASARSVMLGRQASSSR